MEKRVDRELNNSLANNWEDLCNSEEVDDLIADIVAELRSGYRDDRRRHSLSSEEETAWKKLFADVQTEEFREKLAHYLYS